MAKNTLIWLGILVAVNGTSNSTIQNESNGFCSSMFCVNIKTLMKLQNCTVVVGDLKIRIEREKAIDYKSISFPNLKEVTGFVTLYRVFGLQSVGKLFPNLTRIRGMTLLYNYALIVYDMPHLREIGFYNLIKIDRGGVIIWGGPFTCFVNTVDWNAIAPRARHVLIEPDKTANCNVPCSCTRDPLRNRCWNNKKCQRFLEGPEAENCTSQCIGCRKTNLSNCSLCREYSYNGICVSYCPKNTLLLSGTNYCVTKDECRRLDRWEWQSSCVSECPDNFARSERGNVTCVPCHNCQMTCGSLSLHTLESIQNAEKCVYVTKFLSIHVRSIPNVINELQFYLRNLKEIGGYVIIYNSLSLITLDFFQSLQRIKGNILYKGKYSLVVHNMQNLQALFPLNVTENLKIDNGTLSFFNNPMLCMKQIEKLQARFPKEPEDIDLPQGLNGYSASCKEVTIDLKVKVLNETSAVVTFHPISIQNVNYSVLYVKVPYGSNTSIVPEACSKSEWNAINIEMNSLNKGEIQVTLLGLRPASVYAICVEKYGPSSRYLARSTIKNFTTLVGKPEPPFILELVANSSKVIVIRWVDHKDYRAHITHYELDVFLIDIVSTSLPDHCLIMDHNSVEIDYYRHANVMRPPKDYERGCESMCGVLSSVPVGTLVEEYFDICGVINCDHEEVNRPNNFTKAGLIHSIAFNITGPRNSFKVGGLAPYRDYRFKLRACTYEKCSRSVTESVRTLQTQIADIATITQASIDNNGHLLIKWSSPKITNGPLLSYTLEVFPGFEGSEISRVLPQIWCIQANRTSILIKPLAANKYVVKICCTTLGSSYLCSSYRMIDALSPLAESWSLIWWSGVIFGVLLYVASFVIGWKLKPRQKSNDDMTLVDATSMNRNESEPPAIMLSDFVPLYSITYRSAHYE